MKNNFEDKNTLDKTNWPVGPWLFEPDRRNWTTKSGLPGSIVRNHFGALCGYVGIKTDHKYFKINYYDVENTMVHGGLTFSGYREDKDIWWLGFDCTHWGDFCPGMALFSSKEEEYRTIEYVMDQVENLAEQLLKEM